MDVRTLHIILLLQAQRLARRKLSKLRVGHPSVVRLCWSSVSSQTTIQEGKTDLHMFLSAYESNSIDYWNGPVSTAPLTCEDNYRDDEVYTRL